MNLQFQLDLRRLGQEIDEIFRRHGVNDGFGCGDFVVTDHFITDAARVDARISNAIVESAWPRIDSMRVVHYTKCTHAEAIIREREFRLYELFKRVSNDEMRDFFEHHGFQGALNEADGQPGYYEQLKKIFYASFTHEGLDEREEGKLWDEFAPSPNDVRLIFQVDAEASDFRRIKYAVAQKPGIPLIKELQAAASMLGSRALLFRGVTRVAAFYLRGTYSHEDEYRILHARFDETQSGVRIDNSGYRYIPIPLDGQFHFGYRLTPLAVQTRSGTDADLNPKFVALAKTLA